MPSPQRRAKTRTDWLTPAEALYLKTGALTGDQYGHAFATRSADGMWITDHEAARAAWAAHREELYAAMPTGLIPWAAIQFDGAAGRSSHYDHLRG